MKTFLLMISMMFMFAFLPSCEDNTVKRVTADMVGNSLSSTLIVALTCEGKDAVKTDTQAIVDGWFKLNQTSGEKGIVKELCVAAIKDVLPQLLGTGLNSVKPEWKCQLTTIDTGLQYIADLACKNISI